MPERVFMASKSKSKSERSKSTNRSRSFGSRNRGLRGSQSRSGGSSLGQSDENREDQEDQEEQGVSERQQSVKQTRNRSERNIEQAARTANVHAGRHGPHDDTPSDRKTTKPRSNPRSLFTAGSIEKINNAQEANRRSNQMNKALMDKDLEGDITREAAMQAATSNRAENLPTRGIKVQSSVKPPKQSSLTTPPQVRSSYYKGTMKPNGEVVIRPNPEANKPRSFSLPTYDHYERNGSGHDPSKPGYNRNNNFNSYGKDQIEDITLEDYKALGLSALDSIVLGGLEEIVGGYDYMVSDKGISYADAVEKREQESRERQAKHPGATALGEGLAVLSAGPIGLFTKGVGKIVKNGLKPTFKNATGAAKNVPNRVDPLLDDAVNKHLVKPIQDAGKGAVEGLLGEGTPEERLRSGGQGFATGIAGGKIDNYADDVTKNLSNNPAGNVGKNIIDLSTGAAKGIIKDTFKHGDPNKAIGNNINNIPNMILENQINKGKNIVDDHIGKPKRKAIEKTYESLTKSRKGNQINDMQKYGYDPKLAERYPSPPYTRKELETYLNNMRKPLGSLYGYPSGIGPNLYHGM